ncbi:MAG TPA: DUF554 domain-containing protein [candidate division Zixibacteria bacterium]|nr:DUF554 domain-containing protein [candidate division Zixibacteria bacterium]
MLGTLVNTAAVIAGSLVGLLIHAHLPDRLTRIAFQGIGLFTLFIGVRMASETGSLLILIFSMVIGSILGELIDLDKHLGNLSDKLKTKLKSKNEKFTEGLITAFLLWCMGSMTIIGAMEEGFGDPPNLLLAKSVLDGFSSVALAASMGIGVMFAAVPLLIYQGGLTLLASSLRDVMADPVIAEMTAVGGLLLIGLGINILEIKKLKILNMLPALVVAVALALIFL